MKLEWRLGLCLKQTSLTFGAGSDKGTDPGGFSHFARYGLGYKRGLLSEYCEIVIFFNIFIQLLRMLHE